MKNKKTLNAFQLVPLTKVYLRKKYWVNGTNGDAFLCRRPLTELNWIIPALNKVMIYKVTYMARKIYRPPCVFWVPDRENVWEDGTVREIYCPRGRRLPKEIRIKDVLNINEERIS